MLSIFLGWEMHMRSILVHPHLFALPVKLHKLYPFYAQKIYSPDNKIKLKRNFTMTF